MKLVSTVEQPAESDIEKNFISINNQEVPTTGWMTGNNKQTSGAMGQYMAFTSAA